MAEGLGELHITIAAAEFDRDQQGTDILDLAHETRLVKAALLYADRVTLASPKVVMLGSLASLVTVSPGQRRAIALDMASQLRENEGAKEKVRALQRKRNKSVDELLLLRQLQEILDRAAADLVETAERIVQDAHAEDLGQAMAAGLVELDLLGMDEPNADVMQMVRRIADLLAEIVRPNSLTYPMFDDETGDLLEAMIREGKAEAALGHATEAAVAGKLITTLDTFPEAPMSAVLEARNALRRPLIGFRSAVAEMANDLETTPLNGEFPRVVNDLYHRKVAPKLEELAEIAEQLRVRQLLQNATFTATGRKALEAGAGLALGLSTVGELPGLAISALGVSADVAASMYQRRSELVERRGKNQFLFLYEAGRRLRS